MEAMIKLEALRAAALVFLGLGAVFDLRKQALPSAFLAAALAFGSVLAVFLRDGMPWTLLFSFLPGLFLLSLVPATRSGIGAGDGLLLLGIGTLLPLSEILFLLCIGLLLASGYAAVLLLKRCGRNTTFPLVPFLCGGYFLLLLAESFR